MIPPPRAMASMLPVDPIVNDIQHETLRTAYPAASHTRFGVSLSFPGLSRVCRPRSLHAAPIPSNACLHARESPSPALAEHKRGARGGRPRRNSSTPPASLEHANDRSRYHLRRLLAAPERTRQHPGAAGRSPPTGGCLGCPRVRQESDRPAGRGASRPRVCRCPRPAVGPGRSARHPVARRRRPHPLGAACLSCRPRTRTEAG